MSRLALVTGASRGIGRAAALELARRGYRLALAARSTDALTETARLVQSLRGDAITLRCDLSDRGQSARLVDDVRDQAGAPDVLVHVAGVAPSAKLVDAPDDEWDLAMELNATAAFVLFRAALPHMIHQHWGRLVVVASTAGQRGYAYTSAYTASKHAVVGLVRAVALEIAKHGITANAVCPGFTETAILADAVSNIVERTGVSEEEARRRLAAFSPQGRFIEPVEVAKLVAYIASEDAAGINGQCLNIDGGAMTS